MQRNIIRFVIILVLAIKYKSVLLLNKNNTKELTHIKILINELNI